MKTIDDRFWDLSVALFLRGKWTREREENRRSKERKWRRKRRKKFEREFYIEAKT